MTTTATLPSRIRRRATATSIGLLALSLLIAAPAHAELWGEARLGAGLGSGHYEFEQGYVDEMRQPQIAHDEAGPLGVATALEGMGGYAVSPTVAFGLVGRLEITPYVEEIHPRYASLDLQFLTSVGPMLGYRPGKSVDLRLALEWVSTRWTGSRIDIGAVDNIFEFETVSGPGVLFSLGCCAEPGFGVATELHAARLSSEHQLFFPVALTVMATFASR